MRSQCKMANVLLAMMSMVFIIDSCSHKSSDSKVKTTKDSVAISGWFRLVDTDNTPVMRVLLYNQNEFEIATTFSRLYWTDASIMLYSISGESTASEIIYLMHGKESSIYQVAWLSPTTVPNVQFYSIGAHDSITIELAVPNYLLSSIIMDSCRIISMSIPVFRTSRLYTMGQNNCEESNYLTLEIRSSVKVEKMPRFYQYTSPECPTISLNNINDTAKLDSAVELRLMLRPIEQE